MKKAFLMITGSLFGPVSPLGMSTKMVPLQQRLGATKSAKSLFMTTHP
jgi:hypothetical protein